MKISQLFLGVLLLSLNSCAQEIKGDKAANKQADLVYSLYGDSLSVENVISAKKMLATFNSVKVTDSIATKFTAKVTSVCKKKGCWMKVDLENGEEAMVRFKEYSFFVPKDIEGKEVVVKGLAFVEEMSVADQQHYAKDAGKTEEEIAAISAVKKTYGFQATGVLLKK